MGVNPHAGSAETSIKVQWRLPICAAIVTQFVTHIRRDLGLPGYWTSTTANGGTTTSSGGDGLVQTSANANGSAQISSTTVAYFPGHVAWFNSAVRFGDTGAANNTRRIGVFTVSSATPQDGSITSCPGTTLNAVVCKAGTPAAVASASWSRATEAPFTVDTNYHIAFAITGAMADSETTAVAANQVKVMIAYI